VQNSPSSLVDKRVVLDLSILLHCKIAADETTFAALEKRRVQHLHCLEHKTVPVQVPNGRILPRLDSTRLQDTHSLVTTHEHALFLDANRDSTWSETSFYSTNIVASETLVCAATSGAALLEFVANGARRLKVSHDLDGIYMPKSQGLTVEGFH
jgi:hypothetical protein